MGFQLTSTVTAHKDKGRFPEKAADGRHTIASALVRRASSSSRPNLDDFCAQFSKDARIEQNDGSESESEGGKNDCLRVAMSDPRSRFLNLVRTADIVSRSHVRVALRSEVAMEPTLHSTGTVHDTYADNIAWIIQVAEGQEDVTL